MRDNLLDTPPSSVHGDDESVDEVYDEDELEYVGDLDDVLENMENDDDTDDDADPGDSGEEYTPERDDALATFFRHTGSVFCGSIHPEGKLAATGGQDDTLYVWDVETLQVIYEFSDHQDSVILASFSHDGYYLASGDMSGFIRVVKCSTEADSTKWKKICEFETGDLSWGMWHNSARVLVGGTNSGEVYVWKIPSGDVKLLQGHGVKAECGKFSTDGRRLVVGYQCGTLKVWDVKASIAIHSLQNLHSDYISSLDTFHDNNILATGGLDGNVHLTKSNDGKSIGILNIGSEIEALAFSKDTTPSCLAVGTLNGCLTIWDIAKQSIRFVLSDKNDENASGIVTLTWIQHFVAAACLDGSIRIYNSKTGVIIQTLLGHKKGILDLFYNSSSKIFLSTSDDHSAKIYKFDPAIY